MFKGNKAGGILMYGMFLIVFVILWAGWLSGLFSEMASVAVLNGASGVDGFLLSNLNFIIFIFILGSAGAIYNQI